MKLSWPLCVVFVILLICFPLSIAAWRTDQDPIIRYEVRNVSVEKQIYKDSPVDCIENSSGIFCELPSGSNLSLIKTWEESLEK